MNVIRIGEECIMEEIICSVVSVMDSKVVVVEF